MNDEDTPINKQADALYAIARAITHLGTNQTGYGDYGAADVLATAIGESSRRIADALVEVAGSLESCSDHIEGVSISLERISENL